jgi:hypothetical protein
VAARGLLRVDDIVLERDLEDTSAGRHDDDLREGVLEFGKYLFRQTDGSR